MGKFIVIESLDAAGGSTQVKLLAERIKKAGLMSYQFHYPQEDKPTGRIIYDKFLLHKNKQPFSRREQALLYIQDFFSGSEQLHTLLKGSKNILISDRYCTSTMAYQTIGLTGAARKKMIDWITWLCWEQAPALPKPDVVILLDLPVSISLKRLDERGNTKDYFENRQKQEAIRRSYLRLAKEQDWIVIQCAEGDTQKSREAIQEEVWNSAEKLIG